MEAALMNNQENKRLNPQLFSLWVGMAGMIMLFAAFTSAYIVKQGAGNWLQFTIPVKFYLSTLMIIVSSFTLHYGYNCYKKRAFEKFKTMLVISTVLGFGFMVLQYFGWQDLFLNGVDLKANVGGSFFYLITGAHAAHVLGGLSVLVLTCVNAFASVVKYNEKRRNRLEMVLHFWHFLGILWVYLFVFLNVIR
jgi:cytochrome c oxidase subunit III